MHLKPAPSGLVELDGTEPDLISLSGFSDPEREGTWTDGPHASITFLVPDGTRSDVDVRIDARPFLTDGLLSEQIVELGLSGRQLDRWVIQDQVFRRRRLRIDGAAVPDNGRISLDIAIPTCRQPSALGVNADTRSLGIMMRRFAWRLIDGDHRSRDPFAAQFGRAVGAEARKSFDERIESGFWSRFIAGPNVLDIGFKGYVDGGECLPIVEGAIGVDLDYPGYDGTTLPFPDGSQDAVFSSHCLEHIPNYVNAIQEWFRVTRIGGHVIIAVPSAHLYERARRPPSRWNPDHQRFYTPSSLLAEFEAAVRPNTYRVRLLEENDRGYHYDNHPDTHPPGCYEIVLVLEKIQPPAWELGE